MSEHEPAPERRNSSSAPRYRLRIAGKRYSETVDVDAAGITAELGMAWACEALALAETGATWTGTAHGSQGQPGLAYSVRRLEPGCSPRLAEMAAKASTSTSPADEPGA